MKYLFIINPNAGKGNDPEVIANEIRDDMRDCNEFVLHEPNDITYRYARADVKKTGLDEFGIYVTDRSGEAEEVARKFATSLKKHEEGRVFAVGGDGTIHEVVNGIVGEKNVAFGVIPSGLGDDFVKNFDNHVTWARKYRSAAEGKIEKIDLIKYKGEFDGIYREGYCVNMINIGFDSNVVATAAELKKKPYVPANAAYSLAIIKELIRKDTVNLNISSEGKTVDSGDKLLCCIGNGKYCGGSICASPKSKVNDGKFEFVTIEDISTPLFIDMFIPYKEGTYLDMEKGQKVTTSACVENLVVEAADGALFNVAIDGEMAKTSKIELEICHASIDFIVPIMDWNWPGLFADREKHIFAL